MKLVNSDAPHVDRVQYKGHELKIDAHKGEPQIRILTDLDKQHPTLVRLISLRSLVKFGLEGPHRVQLIEAAKWSIDAPAHFRHAMDAAEDLSRAMRTRLASMEAGDPVEPATYDYQESYVAFIDVLGFKSLVNKQQIGQISEALRALRHRQGEIARFKTRHGHDDADITMFSDSIVISHPCNKGGAQKVCYLSGFLARELFRLGVLCRGAVVRGQIYHKDGISFGPGLIDAYELESFTAIYPRIIIALETEKAFYEEYEAMFSLPRPNERHFLKDRDGFSFIDYFDPYYAYWYATGEYEITSTEVKEIEEKLKYFEADAGASRRVLAKIIWLQDTCKQSLSRIPIVER